MAKRLLKFNQGAARVCEYEHGTRESSLLTLLGYSKVAHVSVNVLIDDDKELKFPKNLKPPKQPRQSR